MEENMQHFQNIVLYYFKKGKNIPEIQQKICAVYGEGAVTDQSVKSFMLVISHWMMLHSSINQWKFVAIKLRHLLRTMNVIPCVRYAAYSNYPNQLSYW